MLGDRLSFGGKVDTFTLDYVQNSGNSLSQNSAVFETEIRIREGVNKFDMSGNKVDTINKYIKSRNSHYKEQVEVNVNYNTRRSITSVTIK